MSGLMRRLTDVQRAHGWSDEQLAERCGCKSRMLKLVRAGGSRFGIRPLGTIAHNFPGLRGDVLDYLIEAAGLSVEPNGEPVAA